MAVALSFTARSLWAATGIKTNNQKACKDLWSTLRGEKPEGQDGASVVPIPGQTRSAERGQHSGAPCPCLPVSGCRFSLTRPLTVDAARSACALAVVCNAIRTQLDGRT